MMTKENHKMSRHTQVEITVYCNTIKELHHAIDWAHNRNQNWKAESQNDKDGGWLFAVSLSDEDGDRHDFFDNKVLEAKIRGINPAVLQVLDSKSK